MDKDNKIEEVVEEINPIDEYINNYKELKLAEFCVQKDKEINGLKNALKDTIEERNKMREKAEKHDKTWKSIETLYDEIKKLPVDDYLKLYGMFTRDISGRNNNIATISTSGAFTIY